METNEDLAYSVRDLLGGPAVIQTDTRDTGARLGLVAVNEKTRKMAEYCQSEIEALKAHAKAKLPVTLVHPYGTITVYILEFEVVQSDEKETPGPNKKFHGTIYLQEV